MKYYRRILDTRCLLWATVEDDISFNINLDEMKINSLKDAVIYSAELDMVIPEIEKYYTYVESWKEILKEAKKINNNIIKEYDSEEFRKGKEKYKDIFCNDDFMKAGHNWDHGEISIWKPIRYKWKKRWNWQKDDSEEFELD